MSSTDPLVDLIDYVNTVKPYHTKIYEVLLQYAYKEPVNVTVTDAYQIYVTLMSGSDLDPSTGAGGSAGVTKFVCPGVGWDTGPWDWNDSTLPFGPGTFDFPLLCSEQSENMARATITESFMIEITKFAEEQIDASIAAIPIWHEEGWDTTGWGMTGWEGYYSHWQQIDITSIDVDTVNLSKPATNPDDPAVASITESLVIQVT